MIHVGVVVWAGLLLADAACGNGSPKCIEGASVACACPSGGSGAQICASSGTFSACTCGSPIVAGSGSGSIPSPRPNIAAGASCSLDGLNCSTISTQGQEGWKLHKLVFDARQAGRFAEAICLAQHSFGSTDKVLAGASYFEASNAWEGLKCDAPAMKDIEQSLQVRPRGHSGWKETCDFCMKLGSACTACRLDATTAPCPADDKASLLLARALKTTLKVTVLKCAPGNFPDHGWAFVAWVGVRADDPVSHGGSVDDGHAAHLHHVLLRDTGSLIADGSRDATWHERNNDEETTTKRLEATDLDGDGVDEVVEETEYTRRGWFVGAFDVYVAKGASLASGFNIQTRFTDDGMMSEAGTTTCEAAWNVAANGDGTHDLVVTSKTASGPDAASKCAKSKKYALRAGKFAPR